MVDLIAQGGKPGQRWRRPLAEGQTVVLGREADNWAVPWDEWMSRRHAEIRWEAGRLHVRRLPSARNPIFFRGEEQTEFDLLPDEHFVIGETSFHIASQQTVPLDEAAIFQSRSIGAEELQRLPFRDAPSRLEVLSRLPKVISSASSDAELFIQLTNLLLAGIPRADAVALVALKPAGVSVLYQDSRVPSTAGFQPSQRLVREAIERLQETVLHVWQRSNREQAGGTFTLLGNFDWAFCTPVRNDACRGWGIYVAGRFPSNAEALAPWERNILSDDLKFAELVAQTLGSLRQLQGLQQRQAVLSQFFSPEVLQVLGAQHPEEALKPREVEVTVLFCDLRGFSRRVEHASEQLGAVLKRVSMALEVMTENILDRKGVVADFLGDAALGFWGWPLDDPDKIDRACRAALGIRTMFDCFATSQDHPLADFQVGIGLATGRAVAGKIGSQAQGKVTVFGPVVNLASRLEGMTKLLRVPILLDEVTAQAATGERRGINPPVRCRRLARVLPYGMDTPLLVSELLPRAEEPGVLSDEDVNCYEQALDAFLRGDWDIAYERLHHVPPQDRGKDLLTGFIVKHNRTPPPGWDGIIRLESK